MNWARVRSWCFFLRMTYSQCPFFFGAASGVTFQPYHPAWVGKPTSIPAEKSHASAFTILFMWMLNSLPFFQATNNKMLLVRFPPPRNWLKSISIISKKSPKFMHCTSRFPIASTNKSSLLPPFLCSFLCCIQSCINSRTTTGTTAISFHPRF